MTTGRLGSPESHLGNLILGDAGLAFSSLVVGADNTLTFSQSAECAGVFVRDASNTITFTQLAGLVLEEDADNTIVFSQSAGQVFEEDTDSTITFTQDAVPHVAIELEAENTITFSQSLAVQFVDVEAVSSTLTLSQAVIGFIPNQRATHTLTMVSTVDVDTVLERSASHTLVFNQVAEADVSRITSSEITFTDEADVEVTKGSENTFVMTQDLAVTLTLNPSASSTITFAGIVDPDAVFNRNLSHTFTISHAATSQISKEATASNLFVMASQSQGYKVTRAENTLVFSQLTTINKVVALSVTSTLNFQQDLTRTTTLNLSPASTLVFQHIYLKPTMIGGVYSVTPVPEVIVTKVINRVSFRTKDRAIILRPPLLGDAEGGTGKIVLQRTITGGTYVYARRTSTRTLKYTFETDSFKAFEMRRFMLDCLSEPIWLENWKGEIWVGYFMSNPFAISTRGIAAPCGEWHSFEIEFEGERIH